MKTLLSSCQDASDELGIASPSSIIGATNEDARRLLNAARREVNFLSNKYDWQSTIKSSDIVTVSGQESYDLPGDYRRDLMQTTYDNSNQYRAVPLSYRNYNKLKFGIDGTADINSYYRIIGDKIRFLPENVATGSTITFDYVTKDIVCSASGVPKSDFTVDSDTHVFDDEMVILGIIWRFKRMRGETYNDDKNDYNIHLSDLWAKDGPSMVLCWGSYYDHTNLPDTGYGS